MNQSYKCIYNEQTGAWVAVSELTKNRGKRSKAASVIAGTSLIVAASLAGVTHAQIAIGVDATPTDDGSAVATGKKRKPKKN